MDSKEFWTTIDALRGSKALPGSEQAYNKRLRAQCKKFSKDQLDDFWQQLQTHLARAMTRPTWIAASLLGEGVCGDEAFRDFRCWLVSLGESRFEQAMQNPDSLADVVPEDFHPEDLRLRPLFWSTQQAAASGFDLQALVAMAMTLKAEDIPQQASVDVPLGEKYWELPDESELSTLLPRLRARLANVRLQQDPLIRGYLRTVEVDGLGVVSVGDRLLFRGSPGERKVVAIIDQRIACEHFGGTSLRPDSERYMAITQGEWGPGRASDLNAEQFYRPGQPDPGRHKGPTPVSKRSVDTDLLQARLDAIHARIEKALGHSPLVRFAAYEQDAQDLPLDNLDQIAHPGRIVLSWTDFTDQSLHRSDTLENPTWLQLACEADAQLQRSGDIDHVYLEGIDVLDWEDGAAIAELVMGS